MKPTSRRQFLISGTAASLASGVRAQKQSAQNKLVVGVMGMGGRGRALAKSFHSHPNVEVAMVCDVDSQRVAEAARPYGDKVEAVTDFRRILENKEIDLLVVATCNHWHSPAAILACQAGKHVYVEKPATYNPDEGEMLIAASEKNKVLIQHGTQRRSWPKVIEAITRLTKDQVIGRVYHAHCHYANKRPSIGKGTPLDPPAHLDFDLWQGPAPRRPFKSNLLHYNWHWHWHWGNGELGNNGVHYLDVARWGLGAEIPTKVSCTGGQYRYDDDQETPDTSCTSLEYGDRAYITWRNTSCSPHLPEEKDRFVTFAGENGTLVITNSGYAIYDDAGKEVERVDGPGGNDSHTKNFIDAIRGEAAIHTGAKVAHRSSLPCHLGNISYRTGRTLICDPEKGGRIINDPEAMKLWQRKYEPGWEPKI